MLRSSETRPVIGGTFISVDVTPTADPAVWVAIEGWLMRVIVMSLARL